MPDDFDELFGGWVFPDALACRVVAVTNLADATEHARNIYLAGVEVYHRLGQDPV